MEPTLNLRPPPKPSDIIGMAVRNHQGDKLLGKIQDLAIDVESGRIVEVILSSGGLLEYGNNVNRSATECF